MKVWYWWVLIAIENESYCVSNVLSIPRYLVHDLSQSSVGKNWRWHEAHHLLHLWVACYFSIGDETSLEFCFQKWLRIIWMYGVWENSSLYSAYSICIQRCHLSWPVCLTLNSEFRIETAFSILSLSSQNIIMSSSNISISNFQLSFNKI